MCMALVLARLGATMPRVGGPYAYGREGFGDFVGFWIAWSYWISLLTGNAALAVATASYATVFWPVLGISPAAGLATALAALWTLALVNAHGVRTAGLVQLVTTVLKLLPLAAIGTVGFLYFQADPLPAVQSRGRERLQRRDGDGRADPVGVSGARGGNRPRGRRARPRPHHSEGDDRGDIHRRRRLHCVHGRGDGHHRAGRTGAVHGAVRRRGGLHLGHLGPLDHRSGRHHLLLRSPSTAGFCSPARSRAPPPSTACSRPALHT